MNVCYPKLIIFEENIKLGNINGYKPLKRLSAANAPKDIARQAWLPVSSPAVSDRYVLSTFWIAVADVAGYLDGGEENGQEIELSSRERFVRPAQSEWTVRSLKSTECRYASAATSNRSVLQDCSWENIAKSSYLASW